MNKVSVSRVCWLRLAYSKLQALPSLSLCYRLNSALKDTETETFNVCRLRPKLPAQIAGVCSLKARSHTGNWPKLRTPQGSFVFWACLIVRLSYIDGSGRKFQSDNGSAPLLRRRTALLLRGIRVWGGLGSWRNVIADGGRGILARGSLARRDS